ncbi:bifunctional sulfate adenylyltransferase/adenylylsulfate kinase [Porticoccus sp. W117]|uniref:bifunctional sulfate adenylyltransferase/adenylylsulfate kinase n=1 Tax=Porticoccus sp. W117 TaxID=3054777 RepID=UPI00259ABA0D|nr:bifunctional sulfate adenylyltransferase/adenylylsulfate kinase [Porticoccus sp. W117]MDM3872580.1 bifunctional sulfate adenylyltransferase/adenylylsulfate kinase [Porticoccus sp. W117]
MADALPKPHGGTLVNLLASPQRRQQLHAQSIDWPEWYLDAHQQCDLELLVNGGFSPLTGFMGSADIDSIGKNLRLPCGTAWPLPVMLTVDKKAAQQAEQSGHLVLRDPEGVALAVVQVSEVWRWDRNHYAETFLGTTDEAHPGVRRCFHEMHEYALAGRVEGIELPQHHDFVQLRHTPAQLREQFADMGWSKVVAFQTRNPMHRVHYEISRQVCEQQGAKLLIHPAIGPTIVGDVDAYTRVRCYRALMPRYSEGDAMLSLLPLAMRMAGPREALLHAIVRKNYGCSHLIVGRDHASPGKNARGQSFYEPYDAQHLFEKWQDELGVTLCASPQISYVEEWGKYCASADVPEGTQTQHVSGSELRRLLQRGAEVPDWLSFPEVMDVLKKRYPARHKKGFCVFLTGLSGAGKSTIANVLRVKFLENDSRPVTLLDGDIVRKNLSSELGFSRAHRDLNIRRIGFVASEIAKNGGIALCAPIAPFDRIRCEVKANIEEVGGFVLVYMATPLEECERRDRKGLYAKARSGAIKEFTGISDPYEVPENADVVIDTTDITAESAAQQVLRFLKNEGYIDFNS